MIVHVFLDRVEGPRLGPGEPGGGGGTAHGGEVATTLEGEAMGAVGGTGRPGAVRLGRGVGPPPKAGG
ncbi:hypothetical protein GCM10027160_38170 [Streptomyces calidiresistens]